MSVSRARWVLAATVVAESAWLSAVCSVIGLASGARDGTLPWPTVLLLMAASLAITHLNPSTSAWIERAYRFRAIVGLALVYLATAMHLGEGAAMELGWALAALSGGEADSYRLAGGIDFVLGTIAWWRGGKLASAELLNESLKLTMRLGAAALALVALVDIAHEADLDTSAHVFVFFAAGLGGLGMHRLSEGASQSRKPGGWQSLLIGPVSIVLAIGAIFSLLNRGVLSRISDPALSLLGKVASGLFWAIAAPIVALLNLAIAGFMSFFNRPFNPEAMQQPEITVEQVREGVRQAAFEETELAEEGVQTGYALLLQVIEWTAIALIAAIAVVAAVFLFSRAYRRMLKPAGQADGEDRESLREDADVLSDLGGLLSKLAWGRGRRGKRGRAPSLPNGPPGVVEAIRLYYEMLNLAEKEGLTRSPHQTSNEYRGALARLFPPELVSTATSAFNRAFYGNHEPPEERIAAMRSSLENRRQRPFSPAGRRSG